MKYIVSLATIILSASLWSACSEAHAEKTVSFKVYGNCGMCEKTIEGSLDQEGIYSASWDKDTKMVEIAFDSSRYRMEDLHHLIAGSGYDTDLEKAPDAAYESLHECCQYERPL
ncbi:MAG: ATPase [Chitinophagales bacterium]|nr:copper chaperone [Chitinophagales bacterium]MCB9019110.1 ATPase [Chitinophagales bacterium]MCB9021881.1 ATPase [Chitinophagales bacterium]HPE96827.1 copper chaperone [Chitinophagales bacterium]HRX22808.1 copper chaperone [Chitinophagales bacterium]